VGYRQYGGQQPAFAGYDYPQLPDSNHQRGGYLLGTPERRRRVQRHHYRRGDCLNFRQYATYCAHRRKRQCALRFRYSDVQRHRADRLHDKLVHRFKRRLNREWRLWRNDVLALVNGYHDVLCTSAEHLYRLRFIIALSSDGYNKSIAVIASW
jgi:hypothetical protein